MKFTAGSIAVIAGAVAALVAGVVQRDPLAIGTAVLTLVGVFVRPPTAAEGPK